jgi:hypothetical protein
VTPTFIGDAPLTGAGRIAPIAASALPYAQPTLETLVKSGLQSRGKKRRKGFTPGAVNAASTEEVVTVAGAGAAPFPPFGGAAAGAEDDELPLAGFTPIITIASGSAFNFAIKSASAIVEIEVECLSNTGPPISTVEAAPPPDV